MSGLSRPEDHRRKWDKDEFEQIARLRAQLANDESGSSRNSSDAPKRAPLEYREYKVDLDSRLGKTQVVTKTTPLAQQGGYYCNVCDCVVKDSINFLDHINGKKHQRNLGMSMKVKKSTVEDVRKRFDMNKKKLEEKEKEYDFNERMSEIKEEAKRQKSQRREKKKNRKRKSDVMAEDEAEEETMDPELAAMMGFSGFASTSTGKK
ncbi:zinc finger matrin-type protein 2-like [Symsagittifera roscoffensis]|uniref:zinc finger matrin-type protein 2-like n=1 Tax=Symsagittifera roscoffensis TaxID=84072 RepID=UPI00307C481E